MTNYTVLIMLAEEGKAGRHWYRDARREIRDFANYTGRDFGRLCDLLALFSPRSHVTRACRDAIHYETTGKHRPHVMKSIRLAVEHYEQHGEIRGPKTREFARALRGSRTAVVVDVWMCRALGVSHVHYGDRPRLQRTCDRVVRRLADRLGWAPAEAQAAVWHGTLKRHGRNPGSIRLWEL